MVNEELYQEVFDLCLDLDLEENIKHSEKLSQLILHRLRDKFEEVPEKFEDHLPTRIKRIHRVISQIQEDPYVTTEDIGRSLGVKTPFKKITGYTSASCLGKVIGVPKERLIALEAAIPIINNPDITHQQWREELPLTPPTLSSIYGISKTEIKDNMEEYISLVKKVQGDETKGEYLQNLIDSCQLEKDESLRGKLDNEEEKSEGKSDHNKSLGEELNSEEEQILEGKPDYDKVEKRLKKEGYNPKRTGKKPPRIPVWDYLVKEAGEEKVQRWVEHIKRKTGNKETKESLLAYLD